MRMGGSLERVTLIPLASDTLRKLRLFRLSRARCHKEEEREHLLSVIETGFGSFATFEAAVRSTLAELLLGAAQQQATVRGHPDSGRELKDDLSRAANNQVATNVPGPMKLPPPPGAAKPEVGVRKERDGDMKGVSLQVV